ncbi:hypothetical protein [Phenylobacterium kunshanense]|uniref:Type II toxin-antitoxin system HicB family antitoxin n=1 Tax=Phenylobacterium kunshanense TaxID=1445034 RepID=A0A328BN19_9CAUL|nr:hypothetical protein [Phenylobacterium kunshanense]RAK68782.1 hypothetical protein DJ019_01865 [Phenylobacterium kunshanense]
MKPEPHLELTGHRDGFALRFGDEEVAVYPDFDGVSAGLRAAREAMAMLAACLAMAPEGNV